VALPPLLEGREGGGVCGAHSFYFINQREKNIGILFIWKQEVFPGVNNLEAPDMVTGEKREKREIYGQLR
jgi:hypothetical protein